MNDDFGTCGGGGQGLSLAEGDIQDLNARRQGRLGATGLGQDPPSGIGEGLYGGGSKAAVGAKDKDGAAGAAYPVYAPRIGVESRWPINWTTDTLRTP